ncbi:dienelactone hydrolase [Pontibacillus halophilus JSM 076056 = DSM 19796]|uniref:7,8-dihydroneopterin aldolase n=1 Tax=Pontibacillus halophilus JSM 076056 = DSM 19796 TaxID=1385510 RepID=A0A0A5GG40_9BACI|nr:dihydroneopterin aldolase [Pontibacillus halophilus]KGX90060.1 dienelactone hydrolase [Pontibacillus halophilus JSM 076056 = DSM 19796]
MDKIYMNQLSFYGYHGLFPEENKLGQRFKVDLELHLDLRDAGQEDDMSKSINYADIYNKTQRIVEGEAKNLVEAVAEDIASTLLRSFSRLQACRVKVIKPDPPIPGNYESVAIEVFREREA